MHLVLLDLAANRSAAPDHLAGHERWLRDGIESGAFLFVGSMPGRGGVVALHGLSAGDVERRVAQDPFVAHGVVTAEIIEVVPGLTDPRLAFLGA